MTKILLCAASLLFLAQKQTVAQSVLDQYFSGTNTFKVIGNSSDGLVNPQDLDFVPGRPNEWWVINYEANSGSAVIFYNADKSTQKSEFRRDSHSGHFMIRPSAIAIGDNGNFATTQEVQNTNPNSPTFMGPALWSSDTSIFARMHQSNWDPNLPLGSHIDMLHQSPYSMGVAYDQGNAYWVFDGYNNSICHYDFKQPHAVGADDHSDGEILRYSSLPVTRKPGIPSHMAVDKQNKWLYIVDGGTGRILRLKTDSGMPGMNLTPASGGMEPLAIYREMTGFTSEVVVSSGLSSPCGIDYKDGRIAVSDNATGDIVIYNVTVSPAIEVGRINTGSVGIMGLRIDNDNRIWFVNRNKRELVKIENPNVPLSVDDANNVLATSDIKIYPNPAGNELNISFKDFGNGIIRIFSAAGAKVYETKIDKEHNIKINTSEFSSGMYLVEVNNGQNRVIKKLTIQ